MATPMIPMDEQSICLICASTYTGDRCYFDDRPSHRSTEEQIESIKDMETKAIPANEEYLQALTILSKRLNIAISLTGDMVNRYQKTMQVLIPTLQEIQKYIQELKNANE